MGSESAPPVALIQPKTPLSKPTPQATAYLKIIMILFFFFIIEVIIVSYRKLGKHRKAGKTIRSTTTVSHFGAERKFYFCLLRFATSGRTIKQG